LPEVPLAVEPESIGVSEDLPARRLNDVVGRLVSAKVGAEAKPNERAQPRQVGRDQAFD
jgi:hypothetical protein